LVHVPERGANLVDVPGGFRLPETRRWAFATAFGTQTLDGRRFRQNATLKPVNFVIATRLENWAA